MALYLIRHAQTDYNKKNLWMGLLDLSLNQEGILQAKLAASSLSKTKISIIYSSPLKRAVQTARQIQEFQTPPPYIEVLDGLKERGFGQFEGVSKAKASREKLESHSTVESKIKFIERVKGAMKIIESKLDSTLPDRSVLIVSHSNVFQAILKDLEYSTTPIKTTISNAEYIEIRKPNG